jgi:hypothetical protein
MPAAVIADAMCAASPAASDELPMKIARCAFTGKQLCRILDRAGACRGTGLRCDGMHAKWPEGPALSR